MMTFFIFLQVWDLFSDADRVRGMIRSKVQEESLRTYLFTYSAVYDSLSMDTLASMFELSREMVHSIISKMIINEELMVCLLSIPVFTRCTLVSMRRPPSTSPPTP